MFRISLLTALSLFSSPALAEPVVPLVPPSPGTIEDPNIPVKLIADGPPRPLIRMDAPVRPAETVIAASSLTTTR
jgi:hypothetical protein